MGCPSFEDLLAASYTSRRRVRMTDSNSRSVIPGPHLFIKSFILAWYSSRSPWSRDVTASFHSRSKFLSASVFSAGIIFSLSSELAVKTRYLERYEQARTVTLASLREELRSITSESTRRQLLHVQDEADTERGALANRQMQ
jgi:hypothetical protein